MAEIEELHSRITQALTRIARGVDSWDTTPPEPEAPAIDPEEVAALREALEDEKLANAQLEERVLALKARLTAQPEPSDPSPAEPDAALREQMGAARDASAVLEGEMARLREANDALLSAAESLRHANAQGVGEPDLINTSMQAEIDALKALRAAEAAEIAQLYTALSPLLTEAGVPPGQEADPEDGTAKTAEEEAH